jgi:hypothetical protein
MGSYTCLKYKQKGLPADQNENMATWQIELYATRETVGTFDVHDPLHRAPTVIIRCVGVEFRLWKERLYSSTEYGMYSPIRWRAVKRVVSDDFRSSYYVDITLWDIMRHHELQRRAAARVPRGQEILNSWRQKCQQ